MQNIPS